MQVLVYSWDLTLFYCVYRSTCSVTSWRGVCATGRSYIGCSFCTTGGGIIIITAWKICGGRVIIELDLHPLNKPLALLGFCDITYTHFPIHVLWTYYVFYMQYFTQVPIYDGPHFDFQEAYTRPTTVVSFIVCGSSHGTNIRVHAS